MTIIAVILAAAGAVCSVFASRAVAVLLFAGAAFFLVAPAMNPGGTSGGPRGFSVAAFPSEAPEAHFKGANGKRLSLEDFRGRVVLLNIWATWCGPCRAEMPSLDRLQALHGADGLDVIAVSVDREGAGIVARLLPEERHPQPQALCRQRPSHSVRLPPGWHSHERADRPRGECGGGDDGCGTVGLGGGEGVGEAVLGGVRAAKFFVAYSWMPVFSTNPSLHAETEIDRRQHQSRLVWIRIAVSASRNDILSCVRPAIR